MAEVLPRAGRPEDLEATIEVYRLANDERRGGLSASPNQEERVRALLGGPDALLMIAEDGGAVVGMACAVQGLAGDGEGPPMPGVCFISMVYVAPACWGRGIGGRLVDAVLGEAASRGYDRVQLWTHADNARAQRLYEGHGFWRTGREKDNDLGERIILYERGC